MLEFKNVSYVVSDDLGTKEIIRDVNLKINENEFVAITGPNGGGKSTLAKLMMGILMPTSGQILYKGQDITEMSITERAKLGMGFAFQQPVRFKGIKVKDLITLAAGENTSTANACEYLSEVGLCARDYSMNPPTKPPITLPNALAIGMPLITIIITKIKFKTPLTIANAMANLIESIESIAVKPFSSLNSKAIPLPLFPKML